MPDPIVTKPPAPLKITAAKGFEILCQQLIKAGPDAQKKVAAYISHICGRFTPLPTYHNDKSISDEAKIALYSRCAMAIAYSKWDLLAVDPAPAPRVDPAPPMEEEKPEVEEVEEIEPRVPEPAPKVAPVTPPTVETPRVEVIRDRMSPVAQAILDEISPHLPKQDGGVDEDVVKEMVEAALRDQGEALKKLCEEVFSHQINNGGLPVDRIKALIEEKLQGVTSTRIEFPLPNGETGFIEGLMHPQVPQVAAWLRAGVPTYVNGGAGGGKTTMLEQLAALVGLKPYLFSVDETITVSKIMGFRSAGNGEFFPGFIYESYKNGGLQGADEIDAGSAGVLASANALLSNEWYTFPNGERVKRHPDFRFVAFANTKGMGAVAGYTARNKLDAATLDRFAMVELKYDPGLEMAVACGVGKPTDPWKCGQPADMATQQKYVEWVQKVREHCGESVLVSPRASINGCKALRVGIPMKEVVEALVFKLVIPDTIQRIQSACGLPY